jgi:hypothetical protein
MKNIAILLFVSLLLTNCDNESVPSKECATLATLRDYSSLDGCGYVFELNDGTILLPYYSGIFCGTPPLPKEVTDDPLFNYNFVDGKKVLIGYIETQGLATACMAGKTVKITCIKDVSPSAPAQ